MAICRKIAAGAAVVAYLGLSAISAYSAGGISYDVTFTGIGGAIEDQIESTSRLKSGRDTPPPGLVGLEQRGDTDKETIVAILRSEGYYDGDVDVTVDSDKNPVLVTVHVIPGKRYPIAECKIVYAGAVPAKAPKTCADIGLKPNMPARSAAVIGANAKLIRALNEHGHPAAEITRQEAIVDHLTKTMRLTFNVDPKREAKFDGVEVSGTGRTNPKFLERIVTWKKGEIYDVRKLDDYRKRLSDLSVFSTLELKPDVAKEAADEETPIIVNVKEGKPRTFGGGLRYATTEGPGLTAFWEHRNFWGEAQKLRFDLTLATIEQSLTASLTLPHQFDPGQALNFSTQFAREDTDAYKKIGFTGIASLSTPLGGHWKGTFGTQLDVAEIKQEGSSAFSVLLSFPENVFYDSTDNLLDPTKGYRLNLLGQPVAGTSDGLRAFLILQAEASTYYALDTKKRFVLAGRVKLGSILFSSEDGVPADFRFYGGGGGSVRGFGYQEIGPRDANNNPLGGRGIAEASAELRYRLNQTFGVVWFVDAGTVTDSPDLSGGEAPRIGTGLGLRYYTGIGPLRVDAGVPVNRRKGDAQFQIYISLGQAF